MFSTKVKKKIHTQFPLVCFCVQIRKTFKILINRKCVPFSWIMTDFIEKKMTLKESTLNIFHALPSPWWVSNRHSARGNKILLISPIDGWKNISIHKPFTNFWIQCITMPFQDYYYYNSKSIFFPTVAVMVGGNRPNFFLVTVQKSSWFKLWVITSPTHFLLSVSQELLNHFNASGKIPNLNLLQVQDEW